MINLSARKTGGGVVATLIRGDNNTTRLEIAVARNARDVDLGGLAWRVDICAADSRTDVYTPTEVVVDDREIRFGWLPGGIATAAAGITEFTVVGMAEAENPPVWKSDKQYLQIDDCVDAQPSGEQAAQLGELDKLIVFVQGELAGVLAAGKAAAEAAENARNLPFIGQDGMWRVWDAGKQAYVNTGVRAEGRDGAGAEAFADVNSRISDLENYAQRPFESTGDLVQIDNYEGMPMDCVTRIEPVQAGSGDPSPSNIRPISGRTGAKLTRCGKNLCGGANDVIVQNNPSAATVTYADNVFTLFTADGYADGFIFGHGAFKKGRKYTVSGTAAGYVNLRIYNRSDLTTILHQVTTDANGGFSHTFEAPTDDVVFRVWVNSITTCTLTDFQIEEGDRSEFEPYKGEIFTADFGQTVYGGTLDWDKGLLTVDRAVVTLTGSEVWTASYTANAYMLSAGDNAALFPHGFEVGDYEREYFHACSHYRADVYSAAMRNASCDAFPRNGFGTIRIKDDVHTTLDAWKVFLAEQYAAGTPVQVCYKLATPYTIQLTPGQLTALQGVNCIWSDAGETTVSGRKDVLWLTSNLMRRVAELEGLVAALTAAAAE